MTPQREPRKAASRLPAANPMQVANPRRSADSLKVGAIALVIALSGLVTTARADVDGIIVFDNGSTQRATISQATYEELEYTLPGVRRKQTISVDEVAEIQWADHSRARRALAAGDYDEAISRFESGSNALDPISAMNAKYEYARALDAASVVDGSKVSAAEKAYKDYLSAAEGDKHFYVPHANLDLARLQIRDGRASDASSRVSALASGTYGERYKLEGDFLEGEVELAEKKWSDARRTFSTLRSTPSVSSKPALLRRANLGYARGQFGEGQNEQTVETIQKRIFENKGDEPLDAWAAEALILWGRAEEAEAGSDSEKLELAALRYLRAQSLALVGSDSQCEALYRASEIMGKLGRQGRQQQLRQLLLQASPSSPWGKK